jgi:hypothetical protein
MRPKLGYEISLYLNCPFRLRYGRARALPAAPTALQVRVKAIPQLQMPSVGPRVPARRIRPSEP